MSRVDDVLEAIDAGLQSSPEFGWGGTDYHPDRCARCQRLEPAEDGDLCDGCRAFLLDDSDVDPKSEFARWKLDRWCDAVRAFGVSAEDAAEGWRMAADLALTGNSYVVIDEQWVTDEAWDSAARRSLDESIAHGAIRHVTSRELRWRHPIRCFGGPRDGHWVAYVGDVMDVPVPSPVTWQLDADPLDPMALDWETVRYRAERLALGADLTYCYVADGYRREQITETLAGLCVLARIAPRTRWGTP